MDALPPAHVAECRLVLLPQHDTSRAEASFQCVRPPQTGGCVSNEHALASSCVNATYSVRRGRGRGFRQAPRQAPYSNPLPCFTAGPNRWVYERSMRRQTKE